MLHRAKLSTNNLNQDLLFCNNKVMVVSSSLLRERLFAYLGIICGYYNYLVKLFALRRVTDDRHRNRFLTKETSAPARTVASRNINFTRGTVDSAFTPPRLCRCSSRKFRTICTPRIGSRVVC